MKKLVGVLLVVVMCMVSIPVFAGEKETGMERLGVTLERVTGTETTVEGIKEVENEQGHYVAVVNSNSWANGDWDLRVVSEQPDMTDIKNGCWYCLYDDAYNRLGYVLAVKIKKW